MRPNSDSLVQISYLEPPTIPVGMTIGEFRRSRASRRPEGLLRRLIRRR
jgi:hypothetical protein